MNIETKIWGKLKIEEPVIIELIESDALQRLKGIDQCGYGKTFHPNCIHTRFEHSLGCFLLLRKFNASIKEQISGLIHDVSHSAFSHCIDYVLSSGGGEKQNHQDNIFKDFASKTDIPRILKKHGFDADYILEEKNFPLQESELPDLCADRIDYSLLSSVYYKEISSDKACEIINNLSVVNKKWVFRNLQSAREFSQLFSKLNNIYYSGFESAVVFHAVGDYLKHALQKKYINEEDLYKTDDYVLDKINIHLKSDSELFRLWEKMNNKNFSKKGSPVNYDARIFCKSRAVDPFFQDKDDIKRLSNIDKAWSEKVKEELKPKEHFIKFKNKTKLCLTS